ncbi:MAG: hypothetical protein C0599_05555 [Salinivirgaceae bacterium]|nr:MAG: hypothetical protein C0599_05555 [Salinivirgaceae bacterium]
MAVDIKWHKKNVLITFSGQLISDDIFYPNKVLISDPRFANIRCILIDLSQVTTTNLADDDILVLKALDSSATVWNSNIRMAIIAKNEVSNMLADKYMSLMKNSKIEIRKFSKDVDAKNYCSENHIL